MNGPLYNPGPDLMKVAVFIAECVGGTLVLPPGVAFAEKAGFQAAAVRIFRKLKEEE